MKKIFEKSKFIILAGSLASLLASLFAFAWGVSKLYWVVLEVLKSAGKDPALSVLFIGLMDSFLVAIGLYIFAVGTFELFIADLDLPEWLIIRNLHDLKVKLSSVIILVMAVIFLEHMVEWRDPLGGLYYGLAIAAVSACLIAFTRIKDHS